MDIKEQLEEKLWQAWEVASALAATKWASDECFNKYGAMWDVAVDQLTWFYGIDCDFWWITAPYCK